MYQISRPLNFFRMLNPVHPVRAIVSQLPLFGMLLKNDLSAKFRHSILGCLWLIIPPVCILLIYVYMFSIIFKLRWPEANFSSRWGFGLIIYSGITIYSAFSDSIMGSLNLLSARGGTVKRVPFPYELLPASLASANVLISGIILWILFFLSLLTGGKGSFMVLIYFPLLYIPLWLLTVGGCWFLSALGVFFRDLGNIMGIIILLLFFSTPVFYSVTMIPQQFLWVIHLNPLTPTVLNLRGVLLQNTPPDWSGVVTAWITGTAVFLLGFSFFMRTKRRFADVV